MIIFWKSPTAVPNNGRRRNCYFNDNARETVSELDDKGGKLLHYCYNFLLFMLLKFLVDYILFK